jgi:hypothetical protein
LQRAFCTGSWFFRCETGRQASLRPSPRAKISRRFAFLAFLARVYVDSRGVLGALCFGRDRAGCGTNHDIWSRTPIARHETLGVSVLTDPSELTGKLLSLQKAEFARTDGDCLGEDQMTLTTTLPLALPVSTYAKASLAFENGKTRSTTGRITPASTRDVSSLN